MPVRKSLCAEERRQQRKNNALRDDGETTTARYRNLRGNSLIELMLKAVPVREAAGVSGMAKYLRR